MTAYSITVVVTPGVGECRISVTGEFDVAAAEAFDAAVTTALATSRLLVVDLRDTTFFDCAALCVLERAIERVRETGAALVVADGAAPAVQRLCALAAATLPDRRGESGQPGDASRKPVAEDATAR